MYGSSVAIAGNHSVASLPVVPPLSSPSFIPSIAWSKCPETTSYSRIEESFRVESFFTTLCLRIDHPKPDLTSLREVIEIMRYHDNPLIKASLTKRGGYLGRLFSTEPWAEWAENRTPLGRLVDRMLSYLENPADDTSRLNQDTVLAANRAATELLRRLKQGDNHPIVATSVSLVPSSYSLVASAVHLLVQNIAGMRAGLSPRQLLFMNAVSLPGHAEGVSSKNKLSGSVNLNADGSVRLFIDGIEKIFTKQGELLLHGMDEQWKVIAGDLKDGAEVTLGLIGSGIMEYTREMMRELPGLAKSIGREATAGVWNGIFMSEASIDLVDAIESQFRNGKSFLEILDFLEDESPINLYPRDKTIGYYYLFQIVRRINVPEDLRGTFYLAIARTAERDEHLKSYPGLFWKISENALLAYDSLTLVNHMIPHATVRRMIAEGNQAAINERIDNGFAEMDYLGDGREAMPVVFFDNEDCPPGWEKLPPAFQGRALVCAGDRYPLGSTGGNETHQLIRDELPTYAVGEGDYGVMLRSTTGNSVTVSKPDSSKSGIEPDIVASPTGKLGKDMPFSIMSPYAAYTACKKLPRKKHNEI